MASTVTKICSGCGKLFSFEIEDGHYHQKARKFCSDCVRERKNIWDSGIGAKTTDIMPKKRRKKKPVTIAEMGRFAKANGLSYGMAVALVDSGKLKYVPVPPVKKTEKHSLEQFKKTGQEFVSLESLAEKEQKVID